VPGTNEAGHVFVRFRQTMTLRLPVGVTSLAPPRPLRALPTKLTLAAVAELVELTALAGTGEVPPCPAAPPPSGPACPPPSRPASVTTSPSSSRR
jgi:hypothetical protein